MNYEPSAPGAQHENTPLDSAPEGAAAPHGAETVDAPRRSRTALWLALAIIVISLLAVAAYFALQKQKAGAEDDEDSDAQTAAVTVISPGTTTIEGLISATGTLSARRAIPVGVVGEGGRVVSVTVDQGDWVEAGQVLVVIDRSVQNQQVTSAAAQVEVAKADARLAQSNLDRALQLVERGFISKADVDRLTSTRDAAAARVKVAQAQVRELQARNARLNIYAPTSGLVLERRVEAGQVVSAGSGELFRIARGGELQLDAQLSEADLAKVGVGTAAKVVPAGTEKEFSGQIWQIAPTIDAQSRQGIARIALSYARELRPGGFATATINSGTIVAPMLPESAIQSDAKGSFVYIAGPENKVVRRDIETGLVTDGGIAVTAGLDGSEQVVLRAAGFLTEGETIEPRKQAQPEG